MLWSGHRELWLVSLGAASCCLVVFLARRMGVTDEEGVPIQLGLRPFIRYAPWLVKEIAQANIEVVRMILNPKLPIQPHVVMVKATQSTDLGRVIYANSITLTPGTVSVDMEGDQVTVHALSLEDAEEEIAGEMNRRVTQVEGSS